jgi:hypothetical protein
MAKTIIFPTNENEILSKCITYTKTKKGVTDWNFWSNGCAVSIDNHKKSNFFYESSMLNPISKLDALLDYRKKKRKHLDILEDDTYLTDVDDENQLLTWLSSESFVEKTKATSYYELKNAPGNWVDGDSLLQTLKNESVLFLNKVLIPKIANVASNTLFNFETIYLRGFEFQSSNGKNIFEGNVIVEDSEIRLFVQEYIKMPEDIIETTVLKDASIKNSNCTLRWAFNSVIEDVKLKNEKELKMDSSTLRHFYGSSDIQLENSIMDHVVALNHAGLIHYGDIFMKNLSLKNCKIISNYPINYVGAVEKETDNCLELENITILDYRQSDDEVILDTNMVKNDKIVLY